MASKPLSSIPIQSGGASGGGSPPVKVTTCGMSSCTNPATAVCGSCKVDACATHSGVCGKSGCGKPTCNHCFRSFPGSGVMHCVDCQWTSVGRKETVVSGCPSGLVLPPPSTNSFKFFDPPIEVMEYGESKKAKKKGKRPKNVQAEHFIPNSCYIQGTGRKGKPVVGAEKYTEDGALTYWVGDDQSAGTEHKYLTDRERAIANANDAKGTYATGAEWQAMMQSTMADSLMDHRTYVGPGAGTPQEPEMKLRACNEAAAAFAEQNRINNKKRKIGEDMDLANGVAKGLGGPKYDPGSAEKKKKKAKKGIPSDTKL